MTVENKTVLITGASRGIGAATARYFAENGANVVLSARSTQVIGSMAKDIAAVAVECDVARYDDVRHAVDITIDRFGRLDALINNAGTIDPIARLETGEPDAWGQVVDVNLKGVYHGLRAAIPIMVKQGVGTVINISSGAATSALEGWSHYCATKAAVLSLTRCADKETRERGVRVIGLSPGTVATDMQDAIKASGINPVSRLDPSAHIPPAWVAQAIAFLMGPGGDPYLGTDFSLKTPEGRALVGLGAV
jgi:NAD(P)-dependent dehydrogenase (short-subunit alcohol dehydrogenase family)